MELSKIGNLKALQLLKDIAVYQLQCQLARALGSKVYVHESYRDLMKYVTLPTDIVFDYSNSAELPVINQEVSQSLQLIDYFDKQIQELISQPVEKRNP